MLIVGGESLADWTLFWAAAGNAMVALLHLQRHLKARSCILRGLLPFLRLCVVILLCLLCHPQSPPPRGVDRGARCPAGWRSGTPPWSLQPQRPSASRWVSACRKGGGFTQPGSPGGAVHGTAWLPLIEYTWYCWILTATSSCKTFLCKATRFVLESRAGLGELFHLKDFPSEVSFVNPWVMHFIHRCTPHSETVPYILILPQKLLYKEPARLMAPQKLLSSPSRSQEEPFSVLHFFNRFVLQFSANIAVLLW